MSKEKIEKMFTFQFDFMNPNTGASDEIRFCAKTRDEGKDLFKDWCLNDEDLDEVPPIDDIEVVYDESDAKVYGASYGVPEEYVA